MISRKKTKYTPKPGARGGVFPARHDRLIDVEQEEKAAPPPLLRRVHRLIEKALVENDAYVW